jgi:hypothetical protein
MFGFPKLDANRAANIRAAFVQRGRVGSVFRGRDGLE